MSAYEINHLPINPRELLIIVPAALILAGCKSCFKGARTNSLKGQKRYNVYLRPSSSVRNFYRKIRSANKWSQEETLEDFVY